MRLAVAALILLAPAIARADELPKVTPVGYVEAYWAWNFNRPGNGITNDRGFDNRHDSITLSNAALGATWEAGPIGGKATFQVGAQGATYYASEPSVPAASGANATGPDLWRYVQEAYVTYKAPIGTGIQFQLGLAASPIGIEYMAVKDNWNWSRSNLFFGFPFYHTGLKATYELTDKWSATAAVYNGWNSVVDNNEEKSVSGQVNYKDDHWTFQALYFGGIERNTGSPEGPWWRHHWNTTAQVDMTTYLSFAGEADYGFEPNRFGTARWGAGALYARIKPVNRLWLALRGDRFQEHVVSTPIFYGGAEWVSSGTATLDYRPHDHISLRLEGRQDVAEAPLYFKRQVIGDGSAANPFVANAKRQTTVLLGATAWF